MNATALSVAIEVLDAEAAEAAIPALCGILSEAVASGASVGFMADAAAAEYERFWQGVVAEVADERRAVHARHPPVHDHRGGAPVPGTEGLSTSPGRGLDGAPGRGPPLRGPGQGPRAAVAQAILCRRLPTKEPRARRNTR